MAAGARAGDRTVLWNRAVDVSEMAVGPETLYGLGQREYGDLVALR